MILFKGGLLKPLCAVWGFPFSHLVSETHPWKYKYKPGVEFCYLCMQIPPLVGYTSSFILFLSSTESNFLITHGGRKKLFQSHQSEKLSNIILFIQDNFILLSMHKMLEKKMRTFTHSPWILLFSTSRFSASFCPILSGFRKQQLFLHMTSLKP